MRSLVPSASGQPQTPIPDQKKSVFDRLGRQIEVGHPPMKRRPSIGPYGEYMPPPPPPMPMPPPLFHEVQDYGGRGYNRDTQAEMEWRYQNERRHMQSNPRDRHPQQFPHPPQPPPHPFHYEMEMNNRQQPMPFFPPHLSYHGQPPGGGPPGMMGPPGGPPLAMGGPPIYPSPPHQSSSPKYDRHGNPIVSFKDRARLGPMMDHHSGISPPRSSFVPAPMLHPGMQHPDMPINMRPNDMYSPPHRRPHEGPGGPMELDFRVPRMMPENQFSLIDSRRYQQQQQHMNQPPPPQGGQYYNNAGAGTRYAKWRERRDVITNLDQQTAQSSSRTDSLKSILQQQQPAAVDGKSSGSQQSTGERSTTSKQKPDEAPTTTNGNQRSAVAQSEASAKSKTNKQRAVNNSNEAQDISDGEIVDDEDSSSDDESGNTTDNAAQDRLTTERVDKELNHHVESTTNRPAIEQHQHYVLKEQFGKKPRRGRDGEDYSTMDYETISDDEDLDDFMGDKNKMMLGADGKLDERASEDDGGRNSLSEIELLNALGLDWANLVEMAKQPKSTCDKDASLPGSGSALYRFSLPVYLPTLGITKDLAGNEIYDLLMRACRS